MAGGKFFRKILVLGSSISLLGATLGGAVALDLSDYPAPFIKDGKLNATIVVGQDAKPADVLGAIDIGANLQFHSTRNIDIEGSTEAVTISEGKQIQEGSKDLNLGETLMQIVSSFDQGDFEELLKDEKVEDDDGDTYDYEQEIFLGDQVITFGNPDDDIYDDAVAYLDLEGASLPLLSFVIEFSDDLDATALNDGETIEMFGKQLTFNQNIGDDDEISLFASEKTVFVNQGEAITVEAENDEYEIRVIGGNSDQNTAIIRINGEQESVRGGVTETVGGLKVYVDDVFISNIGQNMVGVKLFIGSDEWVLPNAESGGNSATLEMNNRDVDGVEVIVTGSDNEKIEEIRFEIDPTEFENALTDEDYDWLVSGDEFVEPLFGLKLDFARATPTIKGPNDAKTVISRSGNDLSIDFTTNEQEGCSVDLFSEEDGDIVYYEDFAGVVSAGVGIEEDKIFILTESPNNDPLTKIYEIESIDKGDDEVILRELCTGNSISVGQEDEIENTGVEIDTIANNDNYITLNSRTENEIFSKNDMKISWSHSEVTGTTNSITLTISEDVNNDYAEDMAGDKTISLELEVGDDEIDVGSFSDFEGDNYENDDVEYGMTEYGTYWKRDTDDKRRVEIWYPNRDRYFNVFLAPSDAQVVVSDLVKGDVKTPVRLESGFSMLDTEMNNYENKNLIIVGGPAVNRAAAAVLGLDYPSYEEESGLPQNDAIIKLLEHGDGHYALVVAGWDADDTRRASRVIAEHMKYDLGGKEMVVSQTSMNDILVE